MQGLVSLLPGVESMVPGVPAPLVAELTDSDRPADRLPYRSKGGATSSVGSNQTNVTMRGYSFREGSWERQT
jgi:hypothetical protein